MLSSITPFGERGRHNRFAVTASTFVVGASLGGTSLGAVTGAAGSVLPSRPAVWDAVLAGALALAGALVDARVGGLRLPSTKRQVDENWLRRYRGWVYGFGFGAQLGFGVVTVVTSAATYVAFALSFLAGSVAAGAVIGLVFGLVRGLALLPARRIHDPAQLRAFHRGFESRAAAGARAGVAAQVAIGVVALVALAGVA
jgi:hypothetical protein